MASESEAYLASLGFDTSDVDKAINQTVTLLGHLGSQFDGVSKHTEKAERALLGAAKATDNVAKSSQTASTAVSKNTGSLSQLRYALYDVSTTYGAVSAALLTATGAVAVLDAKFESAFTTVQRTSNDTAQGVDYLRDSLLDMSTQIPKSFEELSNIAAQGNQLGIAASNITNFTSVVAKFSTISGVGANQVADAFGRISNLTGLDPSKYENLASAIAFVARNSASTEASILSMTKEIAAATAGAGFSTDAVVGLAGALSSLSIAPERARGSLSTFFGTLNSAVASGGSALNNFAIITGHTSDEVSKLVRSGQGQQVFLDFLKGLNSYGNNVQVTTALNALNLSQLRVEDTFRRLSSGQGLKVVEKSFNDASTSMAANTEIARQYALVVDDLSSRWMQFVNSINALINVATKGSVGGLADLLGVLTQVVNQARAFAENPLVQRIAQFGGVLAVVVGAFFAYRAAVALATASTYALVTAQEGLAAQGTAIGIKGLLTSLLGLQRAQVASAASSKSAVVGFEALGGAAGSAAPKINAVRGALIAVGRATLIIGIIQGVTELIFNFGESMQFLVGILSAVAPALYDIGDSIARLMVTVGNSLGIFGQTLRSVGSSLLQVNEMGRGGLKIAEKWAAGLTPASNANQDFSASAFDAASAGDAFGGSLGNVADDAEGAAKAVYTLVDYAGDLKSVFSRAFDIRFGGAEASDSIASGWQKITDAVADTNSELQKYQNEMQTLAADRDVLEYWLRVAENYGDALRAGQLRAQLAETDQKLADTSGDLTKAQAQNSKSLIGNGAAAVANRADILGLVQSYEDYIGALAASGVPQAQLQQMAAQLKAEFIAQATQLGYNVNELGLYAAAFDDVSVAINNIPRNITVTADTNPAIQALNEFQAKLDSTRANAGQGISVPAINNPARLTPLGGLLDPSDVGITRRALNISNPEGLILIGQQLYKQGFRDGGWTGNAAPWETVGAVHGREFVLNQTGAQMIPRQVLEAANRGQQYVPQASSQSIQFPKMMMVELSATDRALLAEGKVVYAVISPSEVAGASASVYADQGNRGS